MLALRAWAAYASFMARADCPTCGGSGWKVVERTTEGARALAAEAAGPGAAGGEPKMVWAVPCDCTAGDHTERVLARARVPERYRHCDFENFETDNEIEGAPREDSRVGIAASHRRSSWSSASRRNFPLVRSTGYCSWVPAAWARRILLLRR